MASRDADPPNQSTFTRADEFVRGADVLFSRDFDAEPGAVEDAEEQRILSSLCAILDEFQEQSFLLDPCLEALVSPLLNKLRAEARRPGARLASKRLSRLARLVYFVTKVRGAKTVVRFFPHEVADLSLLVHLLSPNPSGSSSELANATWELRYCLLLWLSVCIRLPFSLSLLATGTSSGIEEIGFSWLDRSGREGEGAQEVLGRYFARNDVDLSKLVHWCEESMSNPDKPLLALALVSSLLIVLSSASPSHILPHFARLYGLLAYLPPPADGRAGAGIAKARAKLAGRLALLKVQAACESGEEDVPDEVEVIVGELIEGLSHPDTISRYSAAKYLSRLSLVLPPDFAAQVVEAVLATFEEALAPAEREGGTGEGKAQGACLAIGEMARRGLLSRQQEGQKDLVARVLDCTLQALAYDHLTSLHPVGSSVRDSASYVLWSLSRTMPSSLLSSRQTQRLAESLLCTACFDREVSVRRAASAAWQEAVGRWGVFPHGIATLRLVDFFTVSVRHRAFLQAAVGVAEFNDYRAAIVTHLIGGDGVASTGTGIAHYDGEIRALSAQALGKVVSAAAEQLGENLAFKQVAKLSKTKDVAKLHGLLLSLAASADALLSLPQRDDLRMTIFRAVCALHPSTRSLKSNHLVLTAALSALASSAPPSPPPSASSAEAPLPANWFDVVYLACDRSEETTHEQAGEAMRRVSAAVDCRKEINRLLLDLDSRSGTRQQAAVLILGRTTYSAETHNDERVAFVVQRLIDLIARDGSKKAATVEGRRNGVDALATLVCVHGRSLATSMPDLLSSALSALTLGFSDYTTDQRGDVGSWVRSATVIAWATLLPMLLPPGAGELAKQKLVDGVVASIIKQAIEKLDGVREAAGSALMKLWEWQSTRDCEGEVVVLRKSDVWREIASAERQEWRDLTWAAERMLPLLSVPEYRDELLEGAVLSNTQYSSATPFLDFALLLPPLPDPTASTSNPYSLLSLLIDLHSLAKRTFASNRHIIPLLSLLSSLAEAGVLDEVALAGDDVADGKGPKTLLNLLALACTGVAKFKSAARLTASAKLAVAFLAVPVVGLAAADKLPLFLAHPQPWLRQQTADELFGAVSALGLDEGGDKGAEGGEGLLAVLGGTNWSGADVDAEGRAKEVVDLLKSALGAR
ncbi:Cin1p [Rhodotorula paludigena]|uniref:Cin1p n=1 Tax=Rhodotorula paludigena TaxID=86838 RepID=UPI0031764C03